VRTHRRRAAATLPKAGSESSSSATGRSALPPEDRARRTASASTMAQAGSASAPREVGAVTWSPFSWSPPLPGRWRRRAMRNRLRYSCRRPACPTKLERPGNCDRHRKTLGSGWAQRPSRGDYGADWRKIRAGVLREEPRCRVCGAPATEVDHIRPLSRGGTHNRSNLRAVCQDCHRSLTAAIPRPRNRASDESFGWPRG